MKMIGKSYSLLASLILLTCSFAFAFVNGIDATVDDLKANGIANPIVALHLKTPDGNVHLCSGTLIRPRVVLTAGHCLSIVKTTDDVTVASQGGLPLLVLR